MDHSEDKSLRGNTADFQLENAVAEEKGFFGSPCSQRIGATQIAKTTARRVR